MTDPSTTGAAAQRPINDAIVRVLMESFEAGEWQFPTEIADRLHRAGFGNVAEMRTLADRMAAEHDIISVADTGGSITNWILAVLIARKETIAERDKLAAFKTFVHGRLDAGGVPVDPPGPHRDEGCRIGQRLDWLFAERDKYRIAWEGASHDRDAKAAERDALLREKPR